MPSLAAEPEMFPSNLLETGADCLDTIPGQWWIFRTRSRCEKAIARTLEKHSVAYYLPQQINKRLHQRRWITTQMPLFPGYIFVYGDSEAHLQALRTNKVVGQIDVVDQARLTDELMNVHNVLQYGEVSDAEDNLPPGTPVEIIEGSLAGIKGTVIRREGRLRLLVGVQMLNRGLSIQVEDWMIQQV